MYVHSLAMHAYSGKHHVILFLLANLVRSTHARQVFLYGRRRHAMVNLLNGRSE